MAWGDFTFAVERIQSITPLERIAFWGGEPLLWEHIDRAIDFCHQRGVMTRLHTNGILIPKNFPTRVKIDLDLFLNQPTLQQRIISNIETYQNKKVSILLLYRFNENDDFFLVKTAVTLAKKYKTLLRFAPKYEGRETSSAFQREAVRSFWWRAVTYAEKEIQQTIPFVHPIQKNWFPREQWELLEKHRARTDCSECALNVPLLNPDGKTIALCPRSKPLFDIRDLYDTEIITKAQKKCSFI